VAEATRPSQKKDWETTSSKEVKQLTEEDLAHYTIFDVIMPLPGWNVDYPGGTMGQLYFDFLTADGLDPNRMRRDQRSVHKHACGRVADPRSVNSPYLAHTEG